MGNTINPQRVFVPPPPAVGADVATLRAWASTLTDHLGAILNRLSTDIALQDVTVARRPTFTRGRDLAAGDVALGASWGAGASFTVSGNDVRGSLTITCGTAPTQHPTLTITFKDGAWPVAPVAVSCRGDIVFPIGPISVSTTTTMMVLTFNGTPVASSVYVLRWLVLG